MMVDGDVGGMMGESDEEEVRSLTESTFEVGPCQQAGEDSVVGTHQNEKLLRSTVQQ